MSSPISPEKMKNSTARAPELSFPATIPALIAHSADHFAGNDFVVTVERTYTFQDAADASKVMAKRLIAEGIGKGTRVGMLCAQTYDWVVTFLAAARIGAFVIPFSSFYKPAELARGLRHGDVHTLIVPNQMLGHKMADFIVEALPELESQNGRKLRLTDAPYLRSVIILGPDSVPSWATAFDPSAPGDNSVSDTLLANIESAVTPSDLVVTIYTSGTTSDPKGVMHSQGSQVRHSGQIARLTGLTEKERVYAGMPFFWVGGLTTTLLPAMHSGSAVLCQERFESGEALDLLEQGNATRIIAWPTLRQRLQADPSFPDRDLSRIAAFPSNPNARHNSLGMTETSGPHTFPPAKETEGVPLEAFKGSFGAGLPFVQHRVVDPATGAPLPDGEVGELCVRGYSLMQGFYKLEREDVFDEDGWYHTGDHGTFRHGCFFFEGRFSEMIKSAGFNVSAREVETELERLPNIESSWVFGIPDADREELVVAGVLPLGEIDLDEVKETLAARLSSYKVPREIVLFTDDEVPLLATGKPDRRAILEIIRSKLAK